MIKGVNKNIIEISDTGNECFERAILFVRPDSGACDSDQLRHRAGEFQMGLKMRAHFYPRRGIWISVLKLAGAAALGAALATAVLSW